MLKEFLFDRTSIPVTTRMLDAASKRQRSIASNIANIETPGYRRKEIVFEEDLKKALAGNGVKGKKTRSEHLPIGRSAPGEVKPRVVIPDDPDTPSGVNNVDVDREMTRLAVNQLMYSSGSRLTALRLEALRTSIRGRR